jgi:flagellar P-ring protein precursor FlgI
MYPWARRPRSAERINYRRVRQRWSCARRILARTLAALPITLWAGAAFPLGLAWAAFASAPIASAQSIPNTGSRDVGPPHDPVTQSQPPAEVLPVPNAPAESPPGVPYTGLQVRIKDITSVEGRRDYVLTGVGLVVGLNGTGGNTPLTRQMLANMVHNLEIDSDPDRRLATRNDAQQKTTNISAVTVTARLPGGLRPGQVFDVVVSAIDDAKSLQGGTLLPTPLKAVDGETYAIAGGSVLVGGFEFSGQAASVQKNHPTAGRVPNGGTLEADLLAPCVPECGLFRLLIHRPDLSTARQIAGTINNHFGAVAQMLDPGTVEVLVPPLAQRDVFGFMSQVEQLRIVPDTVARVVINERTGTIIIGDNVRISRVAIAQGNLAVITGEAPLVSQPAPFSGGVTAVVPRTNIDVIEDRGAVQVLDSTPTVGDLARTLNALGATPRDIIAIFQELYAAGHLHAELIIN